MTVYAVWKPYEAKLVLRAMVVECPVDGKKDSIDSEDKEWRCPDCGKVYSIEELKRRR